MSPPIPSFVLLPDGTSPRSVADLAQMPALAGGTLDMWAYGKHRRAYKARLMTDEGRLSLMADRIMRRNGLKWTADHLAHLNHFLIGEQGYCVPTYTETGLICFTASHTTPAGVPVQFALYPSTYRLGPGVPQVTRWLNSISPNMDTPDW